MKKTILLSVLAALCLFCKVQAQAQPFKIGDKIPDIELSNVLNSPGSGLTLSSLHGKLVILDFWATWCSPCVASIPQLDSIQTDFQDQLLILPVAYQSRDEISKFRDSYQRLHPTYQPRPEVVGDTVLAKLFPHRSLPHYVWISPEGRLMAITETTEITRKTIMQTLQTATFTGIKKQEIMRKYDVHAPLFPAAADSLATIRSTLTPYVDGIGCGLYYNINNSESKVKRITARNLTIPQLYQLAYGRGRSHIGFNRTVLNVADISTVRNTTSGQRYLNWLARGHGYCYELVVKDSTLNPFDLMLTDLKAKFPNYMVSLQNNKVDCWVLEKSGKLDCLADTNETPVVEFSQTGFNIRNRTLNELTNYLDFYVMSGRKMPVLNESGSPAPVDLAIEAQLDDLDALNRQLKPHGLQFVKEKRPVQLLIFNEVTNVKPPLKQ